MAKQQRDVDDPDALVFVVVQSCRLGGVALQPFEVVPRGSIDRQQFATLRAAGVVAVVPRWLAADERARRAMKEESLQHVV